jgi:hypothetical protein
LQSVKFVSLRTIALGVLTAKESRDRNATLRTIVSPRSIRQRARVTPLARLSCSS